MLNVAASVVRQVRTAALVVLCSSGSAFGQSVQTLPPANELVAGSGTNFIPLGASTGGRHLTLFGADQLTGIPVGSMITALQVRQRNAETLPWPSLAANVADYEIWLSESLRTPATLSFTFADNILNPQQVRDGALAIASNAYPGGGASGSTPEGWGPVIAFQNGYVYRGGVLAVEFRSTGGGAPLNFADCTLNGASSAGVGTTVSPTNPTGGNGNAIIVRFTFVPPVPDLAKAVTKVIVGDEYVGAPGPSGDGVLVWNLAFTQQAVAAANQFDTIGPGSDFVGMAMRLGGSQPAWPVSVANFSQYDVQLSRSLNAPGSLSTTVASNVGADAVAVRSGALSLPIGFFGTKGTEATSPFGPELSFTNRYPYRGGPLLSVVRHSGQGSISLTFLDSIPNGSAVQSFQNASNVAAVVGNGSNYAVTRYSVDAGTSSPLNQPAPDVNNTPFNFLPQTTQVVIAASELKYIPVGSVIDSLWLRVALGGINAGAAAPAQLVTATDFEVDMSSATQQPAAMGSSFAGNEGADKVRVHDGAFALAAGALPPASNGNYGKLVQFQKHFVYKGGPLCVTMRHVGMSGLLQGPEALANSASINNVRYANNVVSPDGFEVGSGFNGLAVKLGYIPSVMTPNRLASAEGEDGWSLPFVNTATVQVIIAAEQLRSIDVGSAITGLSFRHSSTGSSTSFPDADRTLTRFDVTMAPAANGPLSASTTFANNIGAGVVTVRSGALTVPKNAFPYSGSISVPAENAWYVPFDRGYVYTGGDLCVTMRSEGLFTSGSQTFDGDGFSPSAQGASVYSYSGSNALTGSLYGLIGLRLAFTARAFCPWDLNNDGVVSDDDFPIFLSAYNTLDCTDGGMAQGCPADFNYDRVVDDSDFEVFIGAYNELLCP
jgi:hypothetical protein